MFHPYEKLPLVCVPTGVNYLGIGAEAITLRSQKNYRYIAV
ncbi:hypothetical protein NIES37_21260 [Tolypothrix tenuis PCC 7101]|uniref:Uncharacterized protein n=1 Tax=Tolypothrix tenuis PCC 7101 TaxID=231146 RepID=A0A1Z4MXK9_9CYAN|nr:hypothetical protein NIES37_21260 [Tolypothrix tenuis PCC 7101]BAZ77903.1 hypothetical protein NIES50_65360 [Aulosira laxa NIES-50]